MGLLNNNYNSIFQSNGFEMSLEARYNETDQMGFVHHAVYPVWFELARVEMIKQTGETYADYEKKGFFIPVLGLEVNYGTPARFGEEFVILTSLTIKDKLRLKFNYEIKSKIGSLHASGSTKHVFLNEDKKPIRIPAFFLDKLFHSTLSPDYKK